MHAPISSSSRISLSSDGNVEGYASLFGEVDQARDMVMPGAFTKTLAQRGLRKIPMLFQHDPAEPVGIWLDLHEDFRGLWARGRLIPDVARGRELLALVSEGAIDGLSIGYRTVRGQIDPKTRVRKLYQVDLWEVSIVTFPLLQGARVTAVKQAPMSRVRAAAERGWTQLTGQHVNGSHLAGSYLNGLGGAADAPAPVMTRGRKASGSPQTCSLRVRADRKRALGTVSAGVAFRRKPEGCERT